VLAEVNEKVERALTMIANLDEGYNADGSCQGDAQYAQMQKDEDTLPPLRPNSYVVWYPKACETITVNAPTPAQAVRIAEVILRQQEGYYGTRLEYLFGEPEIDEVAD